MIRLRRKKPSTPNSRGLLCVTIVSLLVMVPLALFFGYLRSPAGHFVKTYPASTSTSSLRATPSKPESPEALVSTPASEQQQQQQQQQQHPNQNLSPPPPKQEPKPPKQEMHHNNDDRTTRITLVVGLQDQAPNVKSSARRLEFEASFVANLVNPHLFQLLIILHSVSKDTGGCRVLEEGLKKKLEEGVQAPRTAHLSCLEHAGGQPSYYEMFKYTLDPKVEGPIALLSYADQVFDDTLRFAKMIPFDSFWTVSTQGFSIQSVPSRIQETYHRIVTEGDEKVAVTEATAPSQCKVFKAGKGKMGRLYCDSWDTDIFRPETIRQSLKETHFLRPNFYRTPSPFFMGEVGADNAALHSVSQGLASVSFWNACNLMNAWHFDLLAQTSRASAKSYGSWPLGRGQLLQFDDGTKPQIHEPGTRVPNPRAYVPKCDGSDDCFSSNVGSGLFYSSKPMHDVATGEIVGP